MSAANRNRDGDADDARWPPPGARTRRRGDAGNADGDAGGGDGDSAAGPPGRPPVLPYAIPPARESVHDADWDAAIASLLVGLMLCVPFLTGAGAVLLAWDTLRNQHASRRAPRAVAVAGLVLGLANFALWTVLLV